MTYSIVGNMETVSAPHASNRDGK